jgi:DNA-directed RNA polymerase specialized sigma24 family protein
MQPNPQLDALIARENYRELLAELRPEELAVVALRLEGLRYDEAAELLGFTRQGVYQRMRAARSRLRVRFPYLSTRLEHLPGSGKLPGRSASDKRSNP